jgi:hypothetical protein
MSALDTIADKVRAASARPPSEWQSRPSPFLAVGVAFAAGIVLAKWIDWRGHAPGR